MRRSILLFSLFTASGFAFSQDDPTLLGFEVDTLCQYDSGEILVYNLQVEDLDMDSTWIVISNYDPAVVGNLSVISPPYIPTETVRTFIIKADAGFALAAGLNLTDIEITMYDGLYTPVDLLTDVPVYGDLGAFFSVSTLQLCSNGNPVDISSYGTPTGGIFSWVSQQGNVFDPQIYYAEGGAGLTYTYQNTAGCVDYFSGTGPIINAHPNLFVSPTNSTCGNADGYISSSIGGGTPPYDIYWSTGFEETGLTGIPPQTLVNLPAGNYYGNLTDANGCKAVALAQIGDVEIDLSYTTTDETCIYESEDGGVDLTILPSLGTVNYIYWSNGQTTEDLTNVHKGEYLVEIRTDAGCETNASFFVSALPYAYAQNANSTDASCSSSNGVIDYDILGGSGVFTYLWNTGATSEDLFSVPSGTYTCVVTDAVNGCSFEYSHTVYSSGGPGASLVYMNKPTCGQSDGSIDLDVYPFAAPVASVSWNSGPTTEDLSDVPAGEYEITVTALDGCIFKQKFVLENQEPERPSICLLTVDTSLIYNMVVWEKDLSQPAIAGYRIYRETASYGNFELVADRPYALESFFQDNDASPVERSWRYHITAYDACGNESVSSEVHKTIHVVSTTADEIDYDIYWDDYEGLSYTSVDVFRYDSTNGWMNIDNVAAGIHTTSDTPPVTTGLDYLIAFNLADPCTSTKAQDHNSSRSNKSASAFNAGGSTASIGADEETVVTIYPNPASEQFTIYVDDPAGMQYELTSLNGELISSGILFNPATTLSTEEMAAGVYLVRIISDQTITVKKLVKN